MDSNKDYTDSNPSPMAMPGMVRQEKEVSANKLYAAIEAITGHNKTQLRSKLRERTLVEARQIFCALMYEHTEQGLANIGSLVNRDHTTVIHSIKTVKNLTEIDSKFKTKYNAIEGLSTSNISIYHILADGIETVGNATVDERIQKIKQLVSIL
tara:strand:- start:368 stop:829 length:462 start_codon:yes stop_codon:yes gene_type:complete